MRLNENSRLKQENKAHASQRYLVIPLLRNHRQRSLGEKQSQIFLLGSAQKQRHATLFSAVTNRDN